MIPAHTYLATDGRKPRPGVQVSRDDGRLNERHYLPWRESHPPEVHSLLTRGSNRNAV